MSGPVNAGVGATFADANAGSGKTVTVDGQGLSGAAAGNYVFEDASGNPVTTATATADIARKGLRVTVVGNPTKTFDDSTAATLNGSNYRITGFVAGQGLASIRLSATTPARVSVPALRRRSNWVRTTS